MAGQYQEKGSWPELPILLNKEETVHSEWIEVFNTVCEVYKGSRDARHFYRLSPNHGPTASLVVPTARLRLLQPSKGSCRPVSSSAFGSSVPMDGHLPQLLYSNPAAGGASVIQRVSSRHVVGTVADSNAAVSRPSTPMILLSEASRNAPPACVRLFRL